MANRNSEIEDFRQRFRVVGGTEGPGLTGGGDDGTTGGMEARVAKLEAAVEHIQADVSEIKAELRAIRADMHTDFRWLVGGIAGSFLILAGMMTSGFVYGAKALGEILQRLPPPH